MIRAVTRVSTAFLAERRRAGLDRRDEIWNGELHLCPPLHGAQLRLNDALGVFFISCWEEGGLGRTFPATNVKRPGAPPARKEPGEKLPADFRIPERCFLLPERYDRDQDAAADPAVGRTDSRTLDRRLTGDARHPRGLTRRTTAS